MKRIVGKTFKSKTNWSFGPWIFSAVELENCHFDNCMVFASWLLRRRFHARNVRLLNCSQFSSRLDAAMLEDIVVDGWQTEVETITSMPGHAPSATSPCVGGSATSSFETVQRRLG